MGARDFPCHGDSATARPDSARSLPRKPEVRGNHRCRCVSASISSESLSQSLPKSSRPPDRGDATSIVESLRVRVKLTGRRDTAADLDNTKKSCVLVSYKTLACASWCGGPGLSARGGWHSSRRAKSLQRRTTAALKSRANRLNCSSARARVWAPRRPVP